MPEGDVMPGAAAVRGASPGMGSRALLLAVVAGVLVLTLTPRAGSEGGPAGDVFCFLCGERALANLVRNVLLFVPVGAVLARALGSEVRAMLAAVLLTVTIEIAQVWIPGRNPRLVDVVANGAGGALGVAIARWAPVGLRASRRHGALLSLGWSAAVGSVVLATALLLREHPPDSVYHGQWTPDLGHLEPYGGTVLGAVVGDRPVPSSRLDDSRAVRDALRAGEPVLVRVVAGPPTPGVASLFSIHDERRREVLLLGVDGDDLVARTWSVADRMGLHRPDFRFESAFRAVAPGDTVTVGFVPAGARSCLRLDGEAACGLGPRVEEGWAFLLFPAGGRPLLRRGLSATWTALLLLPFALLARRHPLTLVGILVMAGAVAGPVATGWVVPPGRPALLGAIVGAAGGACAAERVRRSEPETRTRSEVLAGAGPVPPV